MSAFLDEYVESISGLPVDLHSRFTRMRELDQRCQDLQKRLSGQYGHELQWIAGDSGITENGTDASPAAASRLNPHLRQEIESSQRACLRLADEKVTLATHAYDLVDVYVQRLDADLHKLNEELKQADRDASGNRADFKAERIAKVGVEGGAGDGEKGGRKSSRRAQTVHSQVATSTARQNVDLELLRELDLPVDPNEPTYCVCNQVSFGEMIACDNDNCKIEWFHYDCVGVTEAAKGKWYCTDCKPLMHQKKRTKN